MEITYDTGAKVILQGPVTYEVESNGWRLPVGGQADRKAGKERRQKDECRNLESPESIFTHPLIHSSLFAVSTPTATVTDLGTEFGVEVDKAGRNHFARLPWLGSSASRFRRRAKRKARGQVLHENQSARVEKGGGQAGIGNRGSESPSRPSSSARFPNARSRCSTWSTWWPAATASPAGGTAGIDPTNGRPTDTWPPTGRHVVAGDGKYHRVEGLPFVDGVFIPDGRLGPVQIDSAGHIFDDFPASCNQTGYHVWAGGAIPVRIKPFADSNRSWTGSTMPRPVMACC